MECQRWPEKLLIWGRSGTRYDAMVTELLSSYCGYKLAEKSLFIIFEQNLANLHFSSHTDYLFMFQNGLDRKDAIFVIVLL